MSTDPSQETSPIEGHEVHVWQLGLEPLGEPMSDLASCLSQDERERAARFRFAIHRRRWVAARMAMRQVLARYTGATPASLRFRYDAHGKPALLPPHDKVHFNLTHSHDLGLLAIAPGPVGIDAERVDRRTDLEALMRHVASEDEREALFRCPVAEKRAGFFRLWTRKEAYIKGRGLGLSLPLRAITVPVTALQGTGDIRVEAEWDDRKPWRLWDLEVPPSYTASLAYAGRIDRLWPHVWPPTDHAATG
ncbi:MAG: 4'-phosphopantetheinyl transferase family protein [Gammaproteobacteria bacterium]